MTRRSVSPVNAVHDLVRHSYERWMVIAWQGKYRTAVDQTKIAEDQRLTNAAHAPFLPSRLTGLCAPLRRPRPAGRPALSTLDQAADGFRPGARETA